MVSLVFVRWRHASDLSIKLGDCLLTFSLSLLEGTQRRRRLEELLDSEELFDEDSEEEVFDEDSVEELEMSSEQDELDTEVELQGMSSELEELDTDELSSEQEELELLDDELTELDAEELEGLALREDLEEELSLLRSRPWRTPRPRMPRASTSRAVKRRTAARRSCL